MPRLALAASVAAAALCGASAFSDPKKEFQDFKLKYGKKYPSQAEESRRFEIFTEALGRIEENNRRNGHPVFGVTFMADRLPEEAYKRGRKGHGSTAFVATAPVYQPPASNALPKAINWRLTKAVTPVKNQGQCGSCWAFSTAEEVESQYILHVSDMHGETFSPQQVNSCTAACDGCGGGDTVVAYQYLQTAPGLASSFFWPYAQGLTPLSECTDSSCTQSCSAHDLSQLQTYEFYIGPYAQVTGFQYAVPPCTDACANQNLALLASAVANAGPVSVCLNAGSWNDYTGGVMTAEGCGSMAYGDIDHCVQLVGFNTTAPMPYWIVRNSWATSFGEEGYIFLEYGKNTCGLADEATIVQVAGMGTPEAAERFRTHYLQATGETEEERAAAEVSI